MTTKRAVVDPLAAVTPAYRQTFHRFQLVIDQVRDAVKSGGLSTDLDLRDVEELEYLRDQFMEIERQMRRYQKEANERGIGG